MDAFSIGTPSWTRDEMIRAIPEFEELLRTAPFGENQGGMGPPHLFLTWFLARHLNPSTIIESGVWKGAGTWILDHACPNAAIFCLEPDLTIQTYHSPQATYHETDFDNFDWSAVDAENALVFIDDHQNAYERIKTAYLWGFRHIVIEDNYPPGHGDCYSPKKLFAAAGHRPHLQPKTIGQRIRDRIAAIFGASAYTHQVPETSAHRAGIGRVCDVYVELPPVVTAERTRFGTKWVDIPSTPPLYASKHEAPAMFTRSAQRYTYFSYLRLKTRA